MSEVAQITSPELQAEARRRLTKTCPHLSEAQVTAWLAQVEAHSGQLVLTLDGSVFATYGRE